MGDATRVCVSHQYVIYVSLSETSHGERRLYVRDISQRPYSGGLGGGVQRLMFSRVLFIHA